MIVLVVLTLFFVCDIGHSARILAVIPSPSFSHQVVYRPIWNELSKRGHDVVVITTDPQNDADLNLTEIDISFAYDVWKEKQVVRTAANIKFNVFKLLEFIVEAFVDLTTQEILHPGVQSLLRNDSEHFDLVIVEYIIPTMFGFSERFNCPYIGIVSMDLTNDYHALLGNPTHPVLYPDALQFGYTEKPNFWQRLTRVIHTGMSILLGSFFERFDKPAVREFMREQFGKDNSLSEIAKKVSMVFINKDPALTVRPMGPAFVLFGGGSHMMPLKSLPEDLKEYLDGAENGFIYFSLGTNVKSDVFDPDKRKIALDAFRELPYKVLWKFDITDIPDVPNNVKIATWLPQQDILRHPNIKVFITQGGLQSTEEATFSHVPIVGIPYVGDQLANVKRVVAKGGGVFLDKDTFTKESLKEAILEVITDPKYKKSITEIAELSRDQPMTGIEKAVWWTEYVIRHKGARHFRNPAMDLPSYQFYLLDVIGFVLIVLSVIIFIFYKLLIFIKNLVVRKFLSRSNKIKSQ